MADAMNHSCWDDHEQPPQLFLGGWWTQLGARLCWHPVPALALVRAAVLALGPS